MKKLAIFILANLLVAGLAVGAQAVVIEFESVAIGGYASINISGVTFTNVYGSLSIDNQSPGPPISNHCLGTGGSQENPFIATFAIPALFVKVGVGDYNGDVDNTYLEAYDASDNLLASDYYQNPASRYGGDYLSISSLIPISYVKFFDAEPYPGAVYWDNFEYTPVPLPGAVWLLGSSLLGLVGWRKMTG